MIPDNGVNPPNISEYQTKVKPKNIIIIQTKKYLKFERYFNFVTSR